MQDGNGDSRDDLIRKHQSIRAALAEVRAVAEDLPKVIADLEALDAVLTAATASPEDADRAQAALDAALPRLQQAKTIRDSTH